MKREELTEVYYGPGSVPPPWATDCPVRFDTWLALAREAEPGQMDSDVKTGKPRQDLILTVNEEHGVRRVLDHLARPEFVPEGLQQSAQPIAAGHFVVIKLTLDELVRAILPLTNLYFVVKQAQILSESELRSALKDGVVGGGLLPDLDQNEERSRERDEQLSWFLRVLAAVAQAGHWGLDETAQMLRRAVLEPELTAPPKNAGDRIIDRRRRHPVVSVTLNRKASACATRSRTTIKADAAEQLFRVDCSNVGWAVIDSGIDAHHPAFYDWDESGQPPRQLSSRIMRAFDLEDAREILHADTLSNGRIDWNLAFPFIEMQVPDRQELSPPPNAYKPVQDSHGTHVAGILGGRWPEKHFTGICPTIALYDFRVLGPGGEGKEFSIVAALQAIRHINEQAGQLVIAGVNLSLSVPHDVAAHSCGWTPVCVECDRLLRSGVVVVAAAGNAAFTGDVKTLGADYQTVSISDPGNTDSVITVGSTHRSDPHRHGVSYFSSRGPTADGRQKPDLLAPGEDIDGPVPGRGIAAMHGTSQAAAHVSGAAAMLIARYRELLGRPDRVKALLCSTATDLGRERAFQGAGLTDVLRAMQAI